MQMNYKGTVIGDSLADEKAIAGMKVLNIF